MSDENYFDIKVDEVYQGVVGKVANLSVGLVDSDNKYDLKVMISNSGEIDDHILEVINQVPELFAENGADGDVSAYTSLSHYLVKESEYQIKKELGLPEYQWTPEELGFNFFNQYTSSGVETVVEKDVYIPSLEGEFPIQFAMKDRYEFEVVNTTPDLLSKTYSEDIDTIKQEALETFKKDQAVTTLKLLQCEFTDKKGLCNDDLYLKHIMFDTIVKPSNIEVDTENMEFKGEVASEFHIVNEANQGTYISDFIRTTTIELPAFKDGREFNVDIESSDYEEGINKYLETFKSHGGFSSSSIERNFDKDDLDKQPPIAYMLSASESQSQENKVKKEKKKEKSLGMSM